MVKRGLASTEHPTNRQILAKEGNPDNQDDKLKALLKHSDEVYIEKIQPIEALDIKRRDLISKTEALQAERNTINKEIARKKAAKEPCEVLFAGMKEMGAKTKEFEKALEAIDQELTELLMGIPNAPSETVPVGSDEKANVEAHKWGTPREFSFKVLDHVDLGANLGILDFDRAAKIAGARFSVLTGTGAKLERALINFMLDTHTNLHGYKEVLPPVMVNSDALKGTGQLPKFEEDLFKLQGYDYYLIPTAEVPVTNLYAREILKEADLPIKHCAYTPCFRSEAGSYGRDTRGLIRQHQFDKVELVKFAHPDNSYEELEKLLNDAEHILQLLGLPYRVVTLSSGDMGFSSAKTYDIEVWLPSQNCYREISSCSNFEDYQARRAQIRYKGIDAKAKTSLVHTLNGSGLAIGRTWLAVIENYQDEGGRIFIPEILRPYMGGLSHIEKC
ncbi:MAG: serine--tRNA ligase [Candidatus Riflebacteria bacterium]|nr:serine--tRNA ligase [Candidatus Riflebacteria bacterium]